MLDVKVYVRLRSIAIDASLYMRQVVFFVTCALQSWRSGFCNWIRLSSLRGRSWSRRNS